MAKSKRIPAHKQMAMGGKGNKPATFKCGGMVKMNKKPAKKPNAKK